MKKLLFTLFLIMFTACASNPTMSGSWLGAESGLTLKLTLHEDSDGNITGSGTMIGNNGESIACDVTGTNAYPNVTLTLSSTGYYDVNFTGKFVDDDTVDGELNGSGFTNFNITLVRQ